MKDYRIGYLTTGHSEYDGEVGKLLTKRHPIQRCFVEFSHLDLADCLVLAGADIRTKLAYDEAHVEIFIDAEDKSGFMRRLDGLITEKYASLATTKARTTD